MKKFVTILLVLCLFFTTATFAKTDDIKNLDGTYLKANMLDKWTVMYYIAGEVDGMDGWADPLIENLTNIKSTPDLNIVVLHDGFENGDLKLFYINSTGRKIDLTKDFGWPDEVDTSNLNTLELFCTQMMNAYPAEHYCLIPITSGGPGWQLLCLHDAHDGDIGVSIPAFAKCLKNIYETTSSRLDVLFTSCAMNMIEVVYEFSDYVNYIVGTQTCLSKEHLVQRFYESVWDLKNDTTMSAEEFASKAPERLKPLSFYYHESYYGELPFLNQILLKFPFKGFHPVLYKESAAVVNLSNIAGLVQSLDKLSQFLIVNDFNSSMKQSVSQAWKDTRKLGECMSNNKIERIIHRKWHFEITSSTRYIDIYHFALLLRNNTGNAYLKSLCTNVMNDINDSISSIEKVEGDPQYGLSIYFSPTKYNYNRYPVFGKLPALYEDLKFSQDTHWDEFLKNYLNI